MTGVLNNADCMITLTGAVFRPSTKEERDDGASKQIRQGVKNVNLTPGFNVVDDDKWTLCSKSDFAQRFLDTGVLVAGVQKSSADIALDKQMQKEIDEEKRIYEMKRPKGASSVLPKSKHDYELESAPTPAPIG